MGSDSKAGAVTPHLGSIDPGLTLEYHSDLFTRKMPWLFPLCLVIDIWAIGWVPGPNPGWLGIPVGVFGLGYAIYARANPSPMLVLTPDGIGYRNISKRLIPWEAIADITVTTHSFRYRGSPVIFSDVTVIWISNEDYDKQIFAHTNPISRWPNWDNNFIREGEQVGIVIPHEMVQLEAAPLRGEIMARWEKFSGRTAGAMAARTERTRQMAMRGTRVRDVVLGVLGFLACLIFLAWAYGWIKLPRDDSAYWAEQAKRNAEIERNVKRLSDDMKRGNDAGSIPPLTFPWETGGERKP